MCVCALGLTKMSVFVRKTEQVWECKRHVEGGGEVASKLQKKLIKNEKRERKEEEEEVGQRRQEWTEVGGGWREWGRVGGEKQEEQGKEWREGSSFLLKTGGQTVRNWLGLQGVKERFKEKNDKEQINR